MGESEGQDAHGQSRLRSAEGERLEWVEWQGDSSLIYEGILSGRDIVHPFLGLVSRLYNCPGLNVVFKKAERKHSFNHCTEKSFIR